MDPYKQIEYLEAEEQMHDFYPYEYFRYSHNRNDPKKEDTWIPETLEI